LQTEDVLNGHQETYSDGTPKGHLSTCSKYTLKWSVLVECTQCRDFLKEVYEIAAIPVK